MLAKWFHGAKELAPLAIRLGLGVIFLAHGSQKLFGAFGGHGVSGVAVFLQQLHVQPPIFWAWVVTLVEFLGGLAVLVGFLTRWAALGLAVDMAVAILLVHAKNGFFGPGGYEYNLAVIAMCLALIFGGPGKISVEGALRKELG